MSASKQNFFAAHWDWLAAVAGFASLAAAVAMYALSLGDSPEASADAFAAQLKSMKPAHEGVQSANLDLLQKALRQMKTPPHLESVNAKKANFLASEGRVFCQQGDADNPKAKKACGRPIPADAEACPFCGVKQHVVKIEADADHDGMPNEWENRYGLNPNEPGDAKRDLDGDGFTNYEEFVAKTDPKSKESHPDYLDSLVVSAPLKHTSLPFYFYGYSRVRDGYRFTFRRKDAKSKFDSTFSALMNDEIGSADMRAMFGFLASEAVPVDALPHVGRPYATSISQSMHTVSGDQNACGAKTARNPPLASRNRVIPSSSSMSNEYPWS
jgi:hypothetical protein